MILQAHLLAEMIGNPDKTDPFVITPPPDLKKLEKSGDASIDLRLGTYFLAPRRSRTALLDVVSAKKKQMPEPRLAKPHYVPFGQPYILHPGSFVLGATLEWIRLPSELAAYVIGKSSWGRRGLVIATATGVHPRFSGCLTLEISNLGEIPVAIRAGMPICQLFVHRTTEKSDRYLPSSFLGMRRPVLGTVKVDEVTMILGGGYSEEDEDAADLQE